MFDCESSTTPQRSDNPRDMVGHHFGCNAITGSRASSAVESEGCFGPSAVWGNPGDGGGPFGNLVRGLELAGPNRAESLPLYLACLTLGGISCVHVAIPVARI
ncbi:uncharacterized protein TrAtP1_002158 [Trichoderma atroviride]|uniref:uncharacterized protein n=1 Tax=Hypocrea atroviridis TaxID=63577 RepID=UPI00332F6C7A|nr:hypothetical protein TrAtP1_002158 [Trichoderma atroviride]